VAGRSNLDVEIRPLWQALEARIDGLGEVERQSRNELDVFCRDGVPFLQIEQRRDHLLLDLWLPAEQLQRARSSGIAKAHPFKEEEAIRVRFERAEDLPRVARWLEASHRHAARRAAAGDGQPEQKRLDHR
jgi:hypothetical protein